MPKACASTQSLPLRGGGARSATERCEELAGQTRLVPRTGAATPLSQPSAASSPQGEPLDSASSQAAPPGAVVGAAFMAARRAVAISAGLPPNALRSHLSSFAGWRILRGFAPSNLGLRRHCKNSSISLASRATSPQGEPLDSASSQASP